MTAAEDTHAVFLQPGELHFGGGMTRISTLLGSCISICLWHPIRRLGGMCHYQLPERKRSAGMPLDGRFADEAFEQLLADIDHHATLPRDYQAKLFGGAAMFEAGTSKQFDIGQRNIERGRELLTRHGIPLLAEHVGGSGRRKLHFEVWNGNVWLAFPQGQDAIARTHHG